MGQIKPRGGAALDYCERCGGVWFDRGEAAALRDSIPSGPAWPLVAQSVYIMQCHGCGADMDRDAEACGACERENVLACPACADPMQVVTHDDLRLDLCLRCRGVWFDAKELTHVWNAALPADTRADGAEHGWNALLLGVDPEVAAEMAARGLDGEAIAALASGRWRRKVGDPVPRSARRGGDTGNSTLGVLNAILDILTLVGGPGHW
jgi:Zn-finger nucleic acid-binding protein